jgi:hypothetical protein
MGRMRITLRAKGQLTLPEAIRSQAWFREADHQAGEREASEQSAREEGESFGSGREFLASLE